MATLRGRQLEGRVGYLLVFRSGLFERQGSSGTRSAVGLTVHCTLLTHMHDNTANLRSYLIA